jgi:hypothetical protein
MNKIKIMRFEIDFVIKNLKTLKGKGKEFITEKELLKASIPKLKMIDNYIAILEKLHGKSKERIFCINELETKIKGKHKHQKQTLGTISRPTLYDWIKKGIIKPYTKDNIISGNNNEDVFININNKSNYQIDTCELLNDLKRIKEIKDAVK